MWLHEACQRVPPHMELLFRAKGEAALARCGWMVGSVRSWVIVRQEYAFDGLHSVSTWHRVV